ncbi:glycosyltransferase [Oenococcus oeni]|uniref:Predicted glycosyltransferase n=3 Tax=Oenococcus oeni TaxID=1247 RepID=Q04DW6_OENOB|nr:glycosyltransferase [Oenococcus oeni]ABJ57356.1 Predicted glycosyltransferase [Oenococcus oeni PSU-1]EJO03392.1 glycosyltransferase [Oenococcus oeni AWRIB418]OIK67311.1 glycosyl transferase [Oenococcus oeni]OIL13607.1 glycosyl transferase [Oenococcus oeni]OIL80898.1 glycosyl transferase [Oenococcus oeni]
MFDVVMVTYNRLDYLKKSINCLKNNSNYIQRVIIVNNGSNKDTLDYLETLKQENIWIHVLNFLENNGGSFGFAQGLSYVKEHYSDNEWTLIMDDDALISSDFLKHISQAILKFPKILAFSGTVKGIESNKVQTAHRAKINYYSGKISKLSTAEYFNNSFNEINLASFVGLIIKNSLIKQIGIPRADFFSQWDDTEYSMRINKVTKIINVSQAEVFHPDPQWKVTHNPDWKYYYIVRNQIVTLRIYMKPFFFLFLLFKKAVHLVEYSIFHILDKNRCGDKEIRMLRDGTLDGFLDKTGVNKKWKP